MKHSLIAIALIAATAAAAVPYSASAGAIERACNSSDRKAANRSLCGCIQQVADLTLSNTDQRKAAAFFKDPQKAQDTRQSDNRSNEAFWKRYKAFGTSASRYCG